MHPRIKIKDLKEKDLLEIFAAFVKCARHMRNFPHPKLTIEQLRSEATLAEMALQCRITEKEWDKINDAAFKDE